MTSQPTHEVPETPAEPDSAVLAMEALIDLGRQRMDALARPRAALEGRTLRKPTPVGPSLAERRASATVDEAPDETPAAAPVAAAPSPEAGHDPQAWEALAAAVDELVGVTLFQQKLIEQLLGTRLRETDLRWSELVKLSKPRSR